MLSRAGESAVVYICVDLLRRAFRVVLKVIDHKILLIGGFFQSEVTEGDTKFPFGSVWLYLLTFAVPERKVK